MMAVMRWVRIWLNTRPSPSGPLAPATRCSVAPASQAATAFSSAPMLAGTFSDR